MVTSITAITVIVHLYEALERDIEELPIYTKYLKNETLPSGCTRAISQTLIDLVGDIRRSMMVYFFVPHVAYHHSVDYDSYLGRSSAL